MEGKKIFVWKQLKEANVQESKHHGGAVTLLVIAGDEAEARILAAHRLRENFDAGAEEADALLSAEPDVWHTDTEPVFEI